MALDVGFEVAAKIEVLALVRDRKRSSALTAMEGINE
jgi:hypothetical protein